MADRMPAYILIGGQMTPAVAEELCQQVCQSGAGWEFGEAYYSDWTEVKKHLLDAMNDEEHLRLCDDNATWGRFESLENWLCENGLPWKRHCSAKYEYDADWTYWQPGMDEPDTVASNEDGEEMLAISSLKHALGQKDPLAAVTALVSEITVPEIPPVELVHFAE
jgi:hypothetical protein